MIVYIDFIMANVIYPPTSLLQARSSIRWVSLFLAGSIEMGSAEPWQDEVISLLSDHKDLTIFNPRRADWDSSWKQEIGNPHFKEQVTWELNALTASDVVVFYFDGNTKSPISMFELGLMAAFSYYKKILVYCPDVFWRKGNIDIVCERYHIPVYSDKSEFMTNLKDLIDNFEIDL